MSATVLSPVSTVWRARRAGDAAQHALLTPGALALLWLPTVGASRAARIATRVAVAGPSEEA